MLRPILLSLALMVPAVAGAEPLTIRAGESWAFAIVKGEPANARRIGSSTKPRRGEIKATLLTSLGTSMTISNNSGTAYTFKAQLIGAPASPKSAPRTCTLPANGAPALEYWPVKATAVRVWSFAPAAAPGRC